MLGLDDIDEILGEIDAAAEMDIEQLEQEAEQIKTGEPADIAGGESVIGDDVPTDATDDIDAEVPDDVDTDVADDVDEELLTEADSGE